MTIKITRFDRFQYLAFLLGGMVPVALVGISELLGLQTGLLEPQVVSKVLVVTIIGLLFGAVAPIVDRLLTDGSLPSRIVFSSQALFSLLFIHILVLYSGGPHVSVFALTYLFLPAVVGHTYGKGVNLYVSAACLAFSYGFILYFPDLNRSWFDPILTSDLTLTNHMAAEAAELGSLSLTEEMDESLNSNAKPIYLIVMLIQMFVTIRIANTHAAGETPNIT